MIEYETEVEKLKGGELPSVDFIFSLPYTEDPRRGIVVEKNIILDGNPVYIRLHPTCPEWAQPGCSRGVQIEIQNGINEEKWEFNEYSDSLVIWLARSTAPTILNPKSHIKAADNSLGFSSVNLFYKEIKTQPGKLSIDDIDMERSRVEDNSLFDSVDTALSILTKLTKAISEGSNQSQLHF
jgi:hypothetical protein